MSSKCGNSFILLSVDLLKLSSRFLNSTIWICNSCKIRTTQPDAVLSSQKHRMESVIAFSRKLTFFSISTQVFANSLLISYLKHQKWPHKRCHGQEFINEMISEKEAANLISFIWSTSSNVNFLLLIGRDFI